ncbi:PQQ-dependent sugar dehydrogenase [Petrachloros mirabilis]
MNATLRQSAYVLLATGLILSIIGMSGKTDVGEKTGRSSDAGFDLVPIVSDGLMSPLFLTHAGDSSGRLFVVEQQGTIRMIERGVLRKKPFLDLKDRVTTKGNEQGLLGLAFHPDHRRNGRLFVNYTRREDGATVVSEFSRKGQELEIEPATERILMVIPQPYPNHNGGMVAFGPDGYLYIGMGDGGSGGDPQNRAQNPDEMLGKMLRIDVDHDRPYGIPKDNPFASKGGRPEVFAMGLRNPWRFSFDRMTGMLWAADVGQDDWEEVDLVVAGGNYGWRIMEGTHCYKPEKGCNPEELIFPLAEYGHEQGRCSITGGYVYRGASISALRGTYLFGDYCSGELFAISAETNRKSSTAPRVLMRTGFRISSFGEDEGGEIYITDHKGALYRLAPSQSKTAH